MYKFTEWRSSSGNWFCGDVSALGEDSNNNYLQAEYLDMPLENFAAMIRMYKAEHCEIVINKPEEKQGLVLYWWVDQAQMRKFKNHINKMFREKAKEKGE